MAKKTKAATTPIPKPTEAGIPPQASLPVRVVRDNPIVVWGLISIALAGFFFWFFPEYAGHLAGKVSLIIVGLSASSIAFWSFMSYAMPKRLVNPDEAGPWTVAESIVFGASLVAYSILSGYIVLAVATGS
jgi:hypothetical protein